MKIWLIHPYDALPGEEWGYQHGTLLSRALCEEGHSVVYWTGSFAHSIKKQRTKCFKELSVAANWTINIIPQVGYKKHIGLKRVLSQVQFALGVLKRGIHSDSPDLIIVTIPSIFSDVASVILAKKHKSLLVVDFRDLWPELFAKALPSKFRHWTKIVFSPLFWMRKFVFDRADGSISVSKTYQSIAFGQSPILSQKPGEIVYCSYTDVQKIKEAIAKHRRPKKSGESKNLIAVYAGTLGENYDIPSLIGACKELQRSNSPIKVWIAGDGPLANTLRDAINNEGLGNVIYFGALDKSRLFELYASADVGLALYGPCSTVSIPTKAFDYFAAGLPVLNSLSGEFSELLSSNDVGRDYIAGDATSLASELTLLLNAGGDLTGKKERISILAEDFDQSSQYLRYTSFIDLLEKRTRTPQSLNFNK